MELFLAFIAFFYSIQGNCAVGYCCYHEFLRVDRSKCSKYLAKAQLLTSTALYHRFNTTDKAKTAQFSNLIDGLQIFTQGILNFGNNLLGNLRPKTFETCEAYYDMDDVYQSEKICDYYCCGICRDRFCCSNSSARLSQFTCADYQPVSKNASSSKNVLVIIFPLISVFFLSVILIASCMRTSSGPKKQQQQQNTRTIHQVMSNIVSSSSSSRHNRVLQQQPLPPSATCSRSTIGLFSLNESLCSSSTEVVPPYSTMTRQQNEDCPPSYDSVVLNV